MLCANLYTNLHTFAVIIQNSQIASPLLCKVEAIEIKTDCFCLYYREVSTKKTRREYPLVLCAIFENAWEDPHSR